MTTPPKPPNPPTPPGRYAELCRAAETLETMRAYGVSGWIRTPVFALLVVAHDEPIGERLREGLAAYRRAKSELARADALAALRGLLEEAVAQRGDQP